MYKTKVFIMRKKNCIQANGLIYAKTIFIVVFKIQNNVRSLCIRYFRGNKWCSRSGVNGKVAISAFGNNFTFRAGRVKPFGYFSTSAYFFDGTKGTGSGLSIIFKIKIRKFGRRAAKATQKSVKVLRPIFSVVSFLQKHRTEENLNSLRWKKGGRNGKGKNVKVSIGERNVSQFFWDKIDFRLRRRN